MKPLRSLITLGFVSGIFVAVTGSALAQSSFTDITVSSEATIGNAISFGQVQLGNTAGAGTSHGLEYPSEIGESIFGANGGKNSNEADCKCCKKDK